MSAKLTIPEPIYYPDSDGKPMADNMLQFDWITLLSGELRELYTGRDDVFIGGDLYWYPLEGDASIRVAPDVLAVFGRPPGYRASYRQWDEAGIPMHVWFEVLSPSNDDAEMEAKFAFYQRYGVEEYYVIEPFENMVQGWRRRGNRLVEIRTMNGHVSSRLGVRFEMAEDELKLFTPDGRKFVQREDRVRELQVESWRREAELKAELNRSKRDRALLAAKLRELGIDPDSLRP